ncbi:MAG: clostripain-related cysteine peptidase, partial [Candidatus Sericytochromatia bacterium]
MKSKPIQKILSALFSLTLLAGCAPQMPTGPMAGFPRAPMFGRFSAQTGANSLLMTDNFTAWQRAEEAQAGFDPDAPSVPVDGEPVAQLPAGGAAKTLTYMSYEALDNNLFDDLNRILDTLELVGSNSQLNLLAQTDNFGPGNAARYFIKNDPMTGPISSPHLKLGNAAENFGDPRVLSDAVRWGFTAYPARFNWLNVSSHGKGFAGIAFDDTPAASMNIVSFAQAVKAGLGARKLDILSFDACLMATVEVASELQDSSNILVGSEDSTYYWGHGFQQT